MATASKAGPFHVGDRVRFEFGFVKVIGKIIEDYGPLGVRGRHLYRVELPMDPDEPHLASLSEDDMELVPPGSEPPPVIDKKKLIEYLVSGGLYSMLGTNRPPKIPPPLVWVCLDHLGNLTYTFDPDRGVLGGRIPPPSAIWNDRIAVDKKDAVVSFVESFGFSRKEAEGVVRKAEANWRRA